MTKVVIANGWTDHNGQYHKPGAVVEVTPSVWRDLDHRGKARLAPADEKSKTESPKPAIAEKEAKKNGN
ncbi:hypothetical protein ICM05_01060 [Leucobacter sp. cx-42]|uniref:hypothetical protein n=1 Tax=unclassified Leucobacter TaxID=2621730 RepID=UPI00165E9947|nr:MULTISPECIES: hypothetical protein [unclassified Leucobacter]MBC9953237.1 hypothetical protein [Leucobacter sp. cx-42]